MPAMARRASPRTRQHGAALFILLLLILVGAGTVFVSRLKSADVDLNSQRKTAAALAQAKQALLGYTAKIDSPGRLPCPDLDNDGGWGKNNVVGIGSSCSSGVWVGRLPWSYLGVDDVRDGSGERIWIAVDNAFINYNGASLNSKDQQPTLNLNGIPVVAVVLSPGGALSMLSQDRTPSGSPNPSLGYKNYLESYSGNPNMATAPASDAFNDQIIGITAGEWFGLVTLRMARALSLEAYKGAMGGTIESIMTKPPVWTDNKWDDAVDGPPGVPAGPSGVSGSVITLKFLNCGVIYTIAGPGAVTLSQRTC